MTKKAELEELNPSDEYQVRLQKLAAWQEAGINPYPASSPHHQAIGELRSNFEKLEKDGETVALAGRLRSIRLHGGSCFVNIEDASGSLQVYLKKDEVGKDPYTLFADNADVGDFVYFKGTLFVTKKGEQTLLVQKYQLLSKSLLPLPEKWHGLKDIELRFRQRYLDLIASEKTRDIFRLRSKVTQYIRDYMIQDGFMEVETPILQPLAGGAIAKPFVTHHNALDFDLYLRIAPELYLKKLIIGGFDKVFEIARCFRNEGIDHEHSPEFTQIEFYWAYQDYEGLMTWFEQFLSSIVKEIKGDYKLEYDGKTYDFQTPWPRLDFYKEIKQRTGLDIDQYPTAFSLREPVAKLGIKVEAEWGRGKILDELYKKFVRAQENGPFYIINHPLDLSPLAKKIAERPEYVERFQAVVAGFEIANAFSELNDPADQHQRFVDQQKLKESGDDEATDYDSEFVEALKYGMPPTAGLGMGIDRIMQLLTDSHNIKEVILFPTLKPKSDNSETN
ncbi:MAG: lysine--tRNA ligase [Candidatus Komeilibacteria bacterium]